MKIITLILFLSIFSIKVNAIQYNIEEFCAYIQLNLQKNSFNNETLQELSTIYENICEKQRK